MISRFGLDDSLLEYEIYQGLINNGRILKLDASRERQSNPIRLHSHPRLTLIPQIFLVDGIQQVCELKPWHELGQGHCFWGCRSLSFWTLLILVLYQMCLEETNSGNEDHDLLGSSVVLDTLDEAIPGFL